MSGGRHARVEESDEPVISMARARLVKADLERLWRQEPDLLPAAELNAVIDGLVADDEAGRRQGVVVQGDALTHHQLHRALTAEGDLEERLRHLPSPLARAVRASTA